MTDRPDPLESSFQAAFAEVLRPRPGDDARLETMIAHAVAAGPEPAATGGGSRLALGLGAAGGAAVLAIALWSGDRPRPSPPSDARPAAAIDRPATPVEVEAPPAPRHGATVRDAGPPQASPPPDEPAPSSATAEKPVPTRTRSREHREEDDASPPPESAATLLARANAARRDGDFEAADRGYGELASRYPRSREAILALVTHGRLLLDELDRPADALEQFSAYLEVRPNGTLAEEAMVGRARSLERLGRPARADAAWAELEARFPHSVHSRATP